MFSACLVFTIGAIEWIYMKELPRINLLITYTNFSQPFVNSSMSCVISSVGILNSGTHKVLPVLF